MKEVLDNLAFDIFLILILIGIVLLYQLCTEKEDIGDERDKNYLVLKLILWTAAITAVMKYMWNP